MNKSLISILLVVFLAVISGCADTGSGGGTSSVDGTGSSGGTGSGDGNYDPSAIPVDETPIVLTKDTSSSGGGTESTEPKAVTITNPRTGEGQYYPILISTAMGLNGEVEIPDIGIVKGIAYITYFGTSNTNSNLVFGEKGDMMYNLTDVTPLKEEEKGTYYVWIKEGNSMPSTGKLVIAFLTEKEAKEYIPNNNNIILSPDGDTWTYNPKFLDNTIVDELNNLGALRQYTFTVKN